VSDGSPANGAGSVPGEIAGRWRRLEDLLDRTLARPADERAAFLEAECAGDPDLARELRSLVEAQTVEHGPLESLAAALGAPVQGEGGATSVRIGPYRLVRELGRGGMGLVYLARRADGQYTREVALKLAQNPMFDASLRERFFAERDILARLSHRNIAALFDGGVTEEGHPYFTMEYVDGRPIDRYCDEERLDVRARVRLFLQVCDAVAAAHRSLVVHRDLKPTNVMIDASGQVKLLDFGIAKLLDPGTRADQTQPAIRLFTREYASPEQLRGAPVTTASDVYSLGALLYRLVTGSPAHRFEGDTPSHVEHVICELPPAAPGVDADLDNVVLKALSKDPARRYASVELLGQDLDHYLRGLPVAARADSAAYRAGKFVKRHRIAVAASLLVAAALMVGTVAPMIQARRAQLAAERAERVSTLVTDLFRLAEPGRMQGGAITARELLDRGSERIATELADDPDAQATMYGVVGRLYRNLALNEPAGRALERALELRRSTSGAESLPYAEALHNLGDVTYERSEYGKAADIYRSALDLRRRLGGAPQDIAASLEGLGRTLSAAGKHIEAQVFLAEAVDLRRRHGGERELVKTMHELALAYLRQGNAAAGEPLFREAVELARRMPPTSADLQIASLVNLARLRHRFERKPHEAQALFVEALGIARRVYPMGHPDIATCLSELAAAVRDTGNLADAETYAAEAVAMYGRLYGPLHREVIVATHRLGGIVGKRGRDAEAERLFRQALTAGRDSLGDSHPSTLAVQEDLAALFKAQGRIAEASALLESAVVATRRAYGENDVYVARAWAALGQLHAAGGDRARAERELRRALDVRRRIHPAGHWRIAEAETALGALLVEAGRHEEAEALLAAAVAALDGGERAREKAAAEKHLAEARKHRAAVVANR
jgi:tetratricopeptide (TPR) repeat protein/predicted Ser/Thr protein kinase